MKERPGMVRKERPGLVLWWLALSPVLYVLSTGPMLWLARKTDPSIISVAYIIVYPPAIWISNHTPLEPVLGPYLDWWADKAERAARAAWDGAQWD